MSRSIRFISSSKKRLTLLVALAVALATSIGAIAYWTTSGVGTGTASAGTWTISLSPTSGHVGDSVSISGTNFPPSTSVSATYDGSPVTLAPATTTNGSGSFSGAAFTVPASTAGSHTVLVNVHNKTATATFTVTPKISLSPSSGAVGDSVTVTGSGFAATSALTATFAGGSGFSLTGAASSGSNGGFTGTLTVPSSSTGAKTVTVTDAAANTANAPYTVTASTATHLVLAAATTTPTAGAANNLTITAQDASNTTVTSYAGDKNLTFGGAANAPDGTHPTVSDKTGTATNFGTAETVTFTNGVATVSGANNGVMKLYKAETATITVTDGTIGNTGLNVTVSAAAASAMRFSTQPGSATVGSAFGQQPVVKTQDAFGNDSTLGLPSSRTVTISIATGTGTLQGTAALDIGTGAGNGTVTFTNLRIDTAGAKTLQVTATGLGTTASTSFTVAQSPQTISFTSTNPSPVTVGGPTYTPTSTSSSGLTVAITLDGTSSGCTLAAGVVSFTAVGTCKIDANQAGSSDYLAATQAQQSITVGQGSQTISFTSTNPSPVSVGDPTYTPTATSSSGLTVAITLDGTSSGCTLSGGVVSFTAVGTCKVDANQAGNANYAAAAQVQQSITVGAPVKIAVVTGAWNTAATWRGKGLIKAGTITTTAGTSVTGVGTSFTTQAPAGSALYKSDGTTLIGVVSSVTNNTSLTLTAGALSTNSAIAYSANNVQAVPAATDTVIIPGTTFTVTVPSSTTAQASSLTVGATATLAVSSSASLTLGGALTNNGTITVGSNGGFSVGGDFANTGTFNCNNGSCIPIALGGNVTNSSTGSISFGGSSTTTVTGDLTNSGILNIGASSTATFGGDVTNSAGSCVTIGANSTTTFPGDFTNNGCNITAGGSSTVNLTSGTAATLGGSGSIAFYFLVINKPATTATLAGPISIIAGGAATLTVTNGTLDNGGFAISGGANTAFTLQAGTTLVTSAALTNAYPTGFTTVTLAATSTVNYAGTSAQTVAAVSYGNLTISGARATNNVTLANGTIAVSGTFSAPATFTSGGYASSGNTVNFNGSGTQTVPAINYNNLTSTNNARTLASSGTIGIAGTFTPGTGTYTTTGSTVDFNGTVAQTVTALTAGYNNLTVSGARATNNVTLASGVIGVAGTFSPTATFTGAGGYVITGNTMNFNGTGAQTLPDFDYNNLTISGARTTNSVTLVNGGTIGVAAALSTTATFTGGGGYVVTGNTVNFNGTTAQTIPVVAPFVYNNIQVNNTAGATLGNAITASNVLGDLRVQTGTLDNGGNAIANGGDTFQVAANATFKLSGTTSAFPTGYTTVTLDPASTVNYAGTGAQTIVALNYGNLTSSLAGARTLASSGAIGIAGAFTAGGNTYTTAGSTVDFNGSGAQTVPVFSFNNLTISGARATNNVTLASGVIGVAGTFSPTATFTGAGGYVITGNTMNFNGTGAQTLPDFDYNNLTISGARTTNSVTLVNGGTIGVAAALSTTATFTGGGGYVVTGNTVNFNGTTAQTIPVVAPFVYNNIQVNNTAGATLGNAITASNVLGDLRVQTGTLDNGGNAIANGGDTFQVAANATFKLSGTTSAFPTGYTTVTLDPASTVNYAGTGAQTIVALNYGNLTSSLAGARTLASSGAIGIAGAFTAGGNTYTTAGSTVDFNGTTAQTVPAPAGGYNNLTISGTGGATASAALTVNGAFLIGSSGSFSGSTFGHTVKGNFTNNGSFTPSTSTFTFAGTSQQTLSGSGLGFNALTLNNSTGILLSGADVTVGGTLTFSSGNITTGANRVIANGTVARTSGYVDGTLQRSVTTGSSTMTFDIGTGATYAPITALAITGASAGGNLTASSTAAQHPSYATSGLSATQYVKRSWTLTPGGGLTVTGYNATFTFVAGDLQGSPNTADLAVRKFSAGTWTAPTSSSSTATTATATGGFTTFGDYAIGNPPATVAAPSPTTAAVGTSVTIAAAHFLGTHALTVTVGAVNATITAGGTTIAAGSSTVTFTVPGVTIGSQQVVVSDGTNSVTSPTNLTVTAGAATQFLVSAPTTATAGTPISGITLTAQDAGGNTATSYTGAHTIAWSGAATSPGGTAPTYPTTSVSFTSGASTTSLTATLFSATGPNVLTASATVPTATGSSASIAVSAAAATVMKFVNCSIASAGGNPACTGQPLVVGNNSDTTFNIQTQDPFGNPSTPTAAITVTFANSDNTFTMGTGSPASITPPANASGQVTLHHAVNGGTDTLTATASAGFPPITLTAKK